MSNPSNKVCRICGNRQNNQVYFIKEMHIGLFEEFEYFECSFCNCIQIAEIPKDLNKFYPTNYYSYIPPKDIENLLCRKIILLIKKALVKYYSGKFNLIGFFISFFYKNPFPWLLKNLVQFDSRILDVGTGTGRLLLSMHRSGFTNLTGIDPYIETSIEYQNNIKIHKTELFNMKGEFDLIMFHHSFEHMDQPLKILIKTKELLSPDGYVLIRIPIAGGFAWRKYRENWVQLDAPRHFFLHSLKSMDILSKKTGFVIEQIEYDSTHFQFTGSEKYTAGISLSSGIELFNRKQINFFNKEAKRLNQTKDGDSACFYLKKA